MEIKEETLDKMVQFLDQFPDGNADHFSIKIGEYKGYNVRVEVCKKYKTDVDI
ncbi:MAG: hypothetical protein IKX44_09455 [Prevotella sp.]|nr:hypothetical protein [Prevotella sp.]